GLTMGKDLGGPDYAMGGYWSSSAWYKFPGDSQFIPAVIGPGRQAMIGMFADLYKQQALTPDFAGLNWPTINKDFYSGKSGIFIADGWGMSETYMNGLLAVQPGATFYLPAPFTAPDGSRGFLADRGFYAFECLSGKLQSDPGKVKRIIDF